LSEKSREVEWILFREDLCSGCRVCMIACSLKHEGRVWLEASRIRIVELVPGIHVAVYCVRCHDHPCVDVCPTGALVFDKEKFIVRVNESKCTLCGKCVDACPGGVPRIVPGKKGVVICDLCGGVPECVRVCQLMGYNALILVRYEPRPQFKGFLKDPLEISKKLKEKYFDGR